MIGVFSSWCASLTRISIIWACLSLTAKRCSWRIRPRSSLLIRLFLRDDASCGALAYLRLLSKGVFGNQVSRERWAYDDLISVIRGTISGADLCALLASR